MVLCIRPALVVLLIGASWGLAQSPAKKDAHRPSHAEVRLSDGSLVRMNVLQENLELMTKYGKLSIPFSDIRRIEFGHHLPDGVEPQISEAIKLMGSTVYKHREDAARELIQLGVLAYPAVQKAARSADLEVAQRASAIIKRIGEKVPPDKLQIKLEDSVQTGDFSISGRIVSPSIKVRSAHFGEFDLKLAELRSIHLRGNSGDVELTIDAAHHGSVPDQWLDSGVLVDNNLKMIIHSEGQVDLWPQGPGQYMTTPKGYNTAGKGGVFMAGSLLGRVGNNGKVFVVGERYEGVPDQEGKIYFHIVPSPWNNASTGSYKLRIRTDYVALSGR